MLLISWLYITTTLHWNKSRSLWEMIWWWFKTSMPLKAYEVQITLRSLVNICLISFVQDYVINFVEQPLIHSTLTNIGVNIVHFSFEIVINLWWICSCSNVSWMEYDSVMPSFQLLVTIDSVYVLRCRRWSYLYWLVIAGSICDVDSH